MFGTPDVSTALVLLALFIALLLALVTYHSARRSYNTLGLGVLVLVTAAALLGRAFSEPSVASFVVLLLVFLAIMLWLLTYQSRGWAHLLWWIGVVLFLLALPFLGAGRSDLALFSVIAGPGILMLVATLYPEVPARYSRLGAPGAAALTREDLASERRRYTRLAGGITLASLAGVWLFGGVPQGPVSEASAPVTFDAAQAQQGQQLFSKYGCAACHSVTGAAGVGPTLKGVYTHKVRLDNGQEITADEGYIRESILQPDAKTVNGFPKGVMVGAIGGNLPEISQPNNLNALVEYVKSLAK